MNPPFHPLPPPVPEPPPLHTQRAAVAGPRVDTFAELRERRIEFRDDRAPRWPIVLLVIASAGLMFLGIAGGVARAVSDATAQAAQLSMQGQYASAIALDYRIAGLGGPLIFLDRGEVSSAGPNAQRAMLAWARALASAGKVDQAVALAASVTDPGLRAEASHERATLLLQAATTAAQHGDYVIAVRRLQQLLQTDPGSAEGKEAGKRLPGYEVGEAGALTTTGHGVDAVTLLDAVAGGDNVDAKQQAQGVFPAALLAAGKEEIAAMSFKEAAVTLQRLTNTYGGSTQAVQAQSLLNARQPVSGTLTDRSGHPISGRVRLSRHFTPVPGGYITSGPFYPSNADADGNFSIDGVPVGGPYVLEVFHNGNWTTLIDPNTGQPADPVMVAALEPTTLTFIVLPS